MNIVVLAVGRLKAGPERELCARYLSRLSAIGPQVGFSKTEVREIPESRASSDSERRRGEAAAIRERSPAGSRLIALDERGRSMTSEEFSALLARIRDGGCPALAMALGGADGLDPELRESAGWTLALGALTWPHQLARLMLLEQIYRAATMLAGHPYHRGG